MFSRFFQVLGAFCEFHPMLESLHVTFYSTPFHFEDDPWAEPGSWKLLKLKDLVYQCLNPDQGCCVFNISIFNEIYSCILITEKLNHLMEACPNIVSLYVGSKEDFDVFCGRRRKSSKKEELPASVDLFSAIRFHRLESLRLIGFQLSDGSYLPSVKRLIL